MIQTILGANGVIGRGLAGNLGHYDTGIRLVSRNPKKVNEDDGLFPADVLDRDQVMKAVEGSDVVYLVVGLQYSTRVWKQQWPVLADNVIEACLATGAKLLFFDNIYSLGKADGWMTEETPFNPCSEKGRVREMVNRKFLDAMKNRGLPLIIARAPDFYGPGALSFVNMMVFENLKKGKTAQLLVNAGTRHSLIFTPDAARATAILGNTDSAWNQVWNLPTAKPPLTGKELVGMAAKAFGRKEKYTVMSKGMLRLIGLFVPVIRESVEMLYQVESDYLFDSSKFEKAFDFSPTSYEEGIKRTALEMIT